MNWVTGLLEGRNIESSVKRLGDLRSVFHDQQTARELDGDIELYRVQVYAPVEGRTEGGLFWGNTVLQPGKVGDEYYMTRGHFHKIRNRAEYYVTCSGEGAVLLMEENGSTRCEWMRPGSIHYIPGHTAHRVANTGSEPLVFIACWPSDAGHDYQTIEHEGFSARLVERGGTPQLVPQG